MGKLVCMFGVVCFVTSDWLNDLNLPSKLLEYVIRYDPLLKEKCERMGCPFDRKTLSNGRCWGYEKNCSFQNTYSAEIGFPSCKFSNKRRKFFDDADFGYVTTRSHMHEICLSSDKEGSALRCSDDMRHCYGVNIFFHFKSWDAKDSKRYRDDIIQPGEVGGNCAEFNGGLIATNMNERGYLRSWADELKHFVSVPTFSVNYNHCDIIFERPTVVMKLDASIDVVWWDTFSGGFVDAFFGETWKVFTDSKPVELTALAGRRVCFKNVLFPLLARQRFGLYYNMPLEEGCHGSGLIHAFSQYILYRLRIIQHGPLLDGVRVTILSRSTQYRRILNLEELLKALEDIPNIIVKVVDYNGHVPFLSQLTSTYNSDVFIGMHGAGLTHLLFLPDWAAIMELYNCGDQHCYRDLARLRGVKYFTWNPDKEHLIYPESTAPKSGSRESYRKFMNYRFDPLEFRQRVELMVEFVRRHPKFVEERRRLRRVLKSEEL